MSKYCMQCGKEIDNDLKKCSFCGAMQDMASVCDSIKKEKAFDPLVAVVTIISTILIIVIVALNLTIFNNEYKNPLDNMVKAMETGDGEYLEEVYPEYLMDDSVDPDEAASSLKAAITLIQGEDFEVSYEVIDKVKINKKDIEDFEERIHENYDDSVSVSGGYTVEIELFFSGNKEKTTTDKVKVYRIDGDWRLTENIAEGLF